MPFISDCIYGSRQVNKEARGTLAGIEETQAALGKSIEQAKVLADKPELLMKRYRKEAQSGTP